VYTELKVNLGDVSINTSQSNTVHWRMHGLKKNLIKKY